MFRVIRVVVVALLALAGLTSSAQAAARYPTYHINWLMLTPERVATVSSFGDTTPDNNGDKFLNIVVHATNKDDVTQEISTDDFKARLSTGQIVDTSFDAPDPSIGATLSSGASFTGNLTFEIPGNVHSANVTWAPSAPCCDVTWPTYTWKFSF
jgi:hypothetical protein